MTPHLVLSQKDGRPMYEQIMAQIKLLIANGDWAAGAKVPSIRELAVASKVSVITVKRAYQELEREGLLVTQQGVGSFVAAEGDLGHQIMQTEIDKYLSSALQHARAYGMSLATLQRRLAELDKQGKDHE
ncbi:MAG: GntR family transcriptional regulator [Lysobacteraceae bacterium]|nr:MAG: GntR family transcriptional regulator [Xanthomonadaceae bacterium]